ncbi:1-(5-phosphoribosyl)-5-[(5-phosphoribosylamino)methylideneamino]imidazole-4-carboxamide isomerase [Aureliella helgolandensis]|uniref:1-(5-phosphoribosyl)-5-[(5-phosphoribosylamino)methylideneamino] imidazole-4-carboxamide isomerase n=1 Tax=Aureliella helgolandensis TaxID=2527968 RepID=A0A518G290_9BACT|nr:1-(5-phosphoribosyl)-5-[(5-phosphoribosylamino)methylideneamino]imidazole-4-carboxamide isomerase [Aureliella helgolandensis]QDV22726.1 1-(5-phosphoribosyl)-5-[(5-phosphoribosylamino)methylideneamino] imidazole-4-carboxamide isomerase [Aureliella helgolandensis]
MEIWPAIDLRGGKCVRLQQGDYARETVFGEDPVAMAMQWKAAGTKYLHLVDLDGAKDGSQVNGEAIRRIVAETGLICQVGGGVRSEETIARLLDLGLQRVIVGTRALRDPEWFAAMAEKYPRRLVLGIDARDGMVATDGWLETSSTTATSLAQKIAGMTQQVAAIVYTDIARDGMLSGPNFEQLAEMQLATDIPIVASGGVTTLEDIAKLQEQRTPAAIVGRAIYEGQLDLAEVLARCPQV